MSSSSAFSENPSLLELKKMIKDCGISHTTLEEVFMKVTGKKVSKYVSGQNKKEIFNGVHAHENDDAEF